MAQNHIAMFSIDKQGHGLSDGKRLYVNIPVRFIIASARWGSAKFSSCDALDIAQLLLRENCV